MQWEAQAAMETRDRQTIEVWTDTEKRQLVAAYRSHGFATCPHDNAVLRSMHVSTQKAGYEVFLRCPTCDQLCFSGDVKEP